MEIRGLGYIGLRAPDLTRWRRFAEDLIGLMPANGAPAPVGDGIRVYFSEELDGLNRFDAPPLGGTSLGSNLCGSRITC